MASVEASKDIQVPLRTAYNQWTQFESFPDFMEGIESATQLTDRRVRFVGDFYGKKESWEALITKQEPDRLVSWTSVSGAKNNGIVRFEPRGSDATRVHVTIEFEPESFVEKVGDALGVAQSRVEGDLSRFKEFVEARGVEEGAWRGQIGSTAGRSS